jgi:hypothetical protein
MHRTVNPASLLLLDTVNVLGGKTTYALANVASE